MTLGLPRTSYGRDALASPLVSPFFKLGSANRSFSNHRELSSQQVPAPLNLQNANFSGPESTETSPWSPFFSPYGAYALHSPLWTPYTPGAIGQERGTPMMSPYTGMFPYQQRTPTKFIGRSPYDYSSSHHNVVDIERIRQGVDVRTTVSC